MGITRSLFRVGKATSSACSGSVLLNHVHNTFRSLNRASSCSHTQHLLHLLSPTPVHFLHPAPTLWLPLSPQHRRGSFQTLPWLRCHSFVSTLNAETEAEDCGAYFPNGFKCNTKYELGQIERALRNKSIIDFSMVVSPFLDSVNTRTVLYIHHPSIFYTHFHWRMDILGLLPTPAHIRQEEGYSLDRSPDYHTHIYKQTTTFTLTPKGKLESPIHLTCMSLRQETHRHGGKC